MQETRQSSSPVDMPKTTPETLDWSKQWYPVHATQDLDPTRPHAIKLLGLLRPLYCEVYYAQNSF